MQGQLTTTRKVGDNELNEDQLKESSGGRGSYSSRTYNGKTVYDVYNGIGKHVYTTDNEEETIKVSERQTSFWN